MSDIQRRLEAASVSLPIADSFAKLVNLAVTKGIHRIGTLEATRGGIKPHTLSTIAPKGTGEPAVPNETFPLVPSASSDAHHDGIRSYSDSWKNYNNASQVSDAGSNRQTSFKHRPSFTNPKPTSPTANVYTHAGRHSNQWLFGDVDLTGLLRRGNKKT